MALNKTLLGKLIEPIERRNTNLQYGEESVRGISNNKEIMPTKADVKPEVLHKFYVIHPGEFTYNPRTTRMGDKVGLGYNDTDQTLLFTFNNLSFGIKDSAKDMLLPDYLYMFFNRAEFDRYAIIHSWGSATELFSFDELSNTPIDLPDIETQRKYVEIYKAMKKNQQNYARGLDDLKLVCEAYIERLSKESPLELLGKYIALSEDKNTSNQYDISAVRGISIEKKFIETKADMTNVNLKNYNIIPPDYFAYVTVTSRNGEKISLALNRSKDTYICSGTYPVFYCTDTEILDPHYLNLILSRNEFNRYARFHSWGSARETFDWGELCQVQIPLPDIKIQRAVASLFDICNERREINECLKSTLKSICPILIRGAITEAEATA